MAFAEPADDSLAALATLTLDAKIYLLDPQPKDAAGSVSSWLYTLDAPNVFLTKETLEENLRENAGKFCMGSEWKALHRSLETHHLEFSFACLNPKAEPMKRAAIAQNLPRVSRP